MSPLTVHLFHSDDPGYFDTIFMNHAPAVGDMIYAKQGKWEVIARGWVIIGSEGKEEVSTDVYELNLIVK